mmetsp:Transcript_105/g.238  ORF Transcript_105/g.238 Transcript_105/m.238 type:complete len:167 (+) Transcript_105:58-558(+)|eukprot:CAMPEP_0118928178 /NCGR_PEP_ID=MMETSP1169-20130426/5488_1 /TAXON_ID=36882 /ORGANISM="Pyramimonas obovata, Strain CCMP722" /LENGTH=166 /DNA_ID=CAMNT_0006870097 /DNA_START=58 /DNA_END=558 /DNA_ORIENTATION=-
MACTAMNVSIVYSSVRSAPSTHRCTLRARPGSRLSASTRLTRRSQQLSLSKRVTSVRTPSLRISAIQVSGPGSNDGPAEGGNKLDHPLILQMKEKIQTALEADSVEIIDVNGDQQHVSIDVVSSFFEGKNSVQRQRAVYKAIWEELQEAVHAVDAMTTKTPEEASK